MDDLDDLERQLKLAEARSRLAVLDPDTLLSEELSAVYLNITLKKIKTLREDGGPKFFKPMSGSAKAANQSSSYTLGELRRWRDEKTYESNIDANVRAGINAFATSRPFFVEKEEIKSVADNPQIDNWGDMLADAIEGNGVRVEWNLPIEAAGKEWSNHAAHKSFADGVMKQMEEERGRIISSVESTLLREILPAGK